MIQELLGGSNVGVIGGERSKPASGDGSTTAAASSATPENLRCPRCDSANTKFCYYNNYNLTQPRHFCKTCRRYWTKGGALRNVPIGGGCRKNKSTTIVGKSSAAGKLKTAPSETAKTGLFTALEHSANPILWASSRNSHFLSLLRPNQNPSHLQNECENLLFGLNSESGFGSNAQGLGLDPFGPAHLSSTELSNPLYRNQTLSGQGQNHGLQELYQRLRSSSASCYPEHAPLILESAPVAAAGELGFWNATLSWPTDHMPTINGGAYP